MWVQRGALSSGSCPPCSFSLVWPWLGSCGLSFVPVHIHARGVFLPGLLEVLGTHTLLSSISWAFWRFGDTHAPFCQQPVHIHARSGGPLGSLHGDTHAPSSSKRPLLCVRAEGTSVFESTQGLKWRELSFRLVSFVWPAPVRFVRSSFFVRPVHIYARSKGSVSFLFVAF